ncbi:tRNA (adenosine(37)-N6)-threonylcarbamoyltransferase complex dimerization subunit type 1 TsaB, partial [Francisella tularensis subsp. holarctica]|nr:tRNA (adenosine(37)-N6)-threonylcarbamoyltransferase complex dimerization subunit type 1 TsaB [Francisella tularensis subsp. holarctica]
DFTIDVANVVDYVYQHYQTHKYDGTLTHETFPVDLRGTSHWQAKKE